MGAAPGPWTPGYAVNSPTVSTEGRSLRVPKLTTSGGCGERWPVPFALKGFGSNTWQAIMREPALGGGDKWRWPPQVPWHAKRPEAHWRGASYSF